MTYEERLKRRTHAIKLRQSGKTYYAIAREIGVCWQRAQQIVNGKEPTPPQDPKPNIGKEGREYTRWLRRMMDDFTCQSCGQRWRKGERQFDIHHLGGLCGKKSRAYDKLKDVDKLITLCHKCHYWHPQHSYRIRNIKKLRRQ